jgi:hypothetical protein
VTGSKKRNTAPWGVFAAADRRPPCASTIERLIDKPMPSPSAQIHGYILSSRRRFGLYAQFVASRNN